MIREIGEALYGSRWQAGMADALGVNLRTVRRWAAGTTEPPPGACADLLGIMRERIGELAELAEQIREKAK